jgi:hypothetical protein
MAKARRLYLYTISWFGLLFSVVAAALLMRLILNHLGVGASRSALSSLSPLLGQSVTSSDKEILSISLPLLVVGLGLWLVHWGIQERMVWGNDEAAAEERASVFRSVYFVSVLALSLLIAAATWASLIADAVSDRLNAKPASSAADDDWLLAIAIVATAVWAYHAWVRMRDVDRGTAIERAAAWSSRLYLYGAAAIGVLGIVASASSLIGIVLREMAGLGNAYALDLNGLNLSGLDLGQLTAPSSGTWWTRPAVAALVSLAVWAAVWAAHWRYSLRICQMPTPFADAERRSRSRLAYPVIVVWLSVAFVGQGLASSLSYVLEELMSLTTPTPFWYFVVSPTLTVAPAAVAWWWHRRQALTESATGPIGVSATRVLGYFTAWVGLNIWGLGAATAIQALLGDLFPIYSSSGLSLGSIYDEMWKTQLATGAAAVVVGLSIWGVPWLAARRRRAADWLTETRSSSRSFYLYLVEASWLLGGALLLVVVLYPYLRVALSLPEPNLAAEVEGPLAIVVVSGLLVAYHYRVMRGDQAGPPPAAVAAGAPQPFAQPPMPETPAMPKTPAASEMPAPAVPPVPPAPPAPSDPAAPDAEGGQPSTEGGEDAQPPLG